MGDNRLVLVASFDAGYQADIAKSLLDEEGIPAFLHDDQIVAMDWMLAAAVGGVKLRVRDVDAERARNVLHQHLRPAEYAEGRAVDEDELTRQALEAEPEDGVVEVARADSLASAIEANENDPDSLRREDYARRFLRTSAFSFLFEPLWFYALYLVLQAMFSKGRLSSEGASRILYGGILCVAHPVFWYWIYIHFIADSDY